MVVLVDRGTRLLVQGITGREGSTHTLSMIRYGTKVVAGVSPGKAGEKVHGVPVYGSVRRAMEEHPEINASIVFVPAPYAADAVYEALDHGIKLVVVITEHVPVHDAMRLVHYAKRRGAIIVGPNCPGIISPGLAKVGIMPGHLFTEGWVGLISRSGTLTYEIAWALTRAGIGCSTALGIGGDPITGLNFVEAVKLFYDDPQTKKLVVIGEIGGDEEERLARFVAQEGMKKEIVAFVAGRTAPPGKRMGHAGAIITMGSGDAEGKIKAFREAGIKVAELPSHIPHLLR